MSYEIEKHKRVLSLKTDDKRFSPYLGETLIYLSASVSNNVSPRTFEWDVIVVDHSSDWAGETMLPKKIWEMGYWADGGGIKPNDRNVSGLTYVKQWKDAVAARYPVLDSAGRPLWYPTGKLMGLLDAATGMFVSLLAVPLFEHDVRGGVGLHAILRAGDILLGDRAFCSFAHLALLRARGAFACMRLHQARKDQTHGRQRWTKDKKRPAWMDEAQYASLPAFIDVRVVAYAVRHKGFRSRRVAIATTLLDAIIWPDARVAELYGHRWQIETCFAHLKTTMRMDVLRCKTPDGVMKEVAVYLVVYNLVRMTMLRAAAQQGVAAVRRVSFVDAMRLLAARMLGLTGVAKLIVNPDRAGRTQLRVIRRRPKAYDWLIVSRREKEAEIRRKQAELA